MVFVEKYAKLAKSAILKYGEFMKWGQYSYIDKVTIKLYLATRKDEPNRYVDIIGRDMRCNIALEMLSGAQTQTTIRSEV